MWEGCGTGSGVAESRAMWMASARSLSSIKLIVCVAQDAVASTAVHLQPDVLDVLEKTCRHADMQTSRHAQARPKGGEWNQRKRAPADVPAAMRSFPHHATHSMDA